MADQNRLKKHVWLIMLICSILFLIWDIFVMTRGTEILPTGFKLAGSLQQTSDIEKNALAFMNMAMLKPLWEEIWIGILGIFIALRLRKQKRYAWILGVFWGIMMIYNAAIQGGYELFVLGWSKVCLQTYSFLILGLIALISLFIVKKGFAGNRQIDSL